MSSSPDHPYDYTNDPASALFGTDPALLPPDPEPENHFGQTFEGTLVNTETDKTPSPGAVKMLEFMIAGAFGLVIAAFILLLGWNALEWVHLR